MINLYKSFMYDLVKTHNQTSLVLENYLLTLKEFKHYHNALKKDNLIVLSIFSGLENDFINFIKDNYKILLFVKYNNNITLVLQKTIMKKDYDIPIGAIPYVVNSTNKISAYLSKLVGEYTKFNYELFKQSHKTILKILPLSKIENKYWKDIEELLDIYLYCNSNIYMTHLHNLLSKTKQTITLDPKSKYNLAYISINTLFVKDTIKGNNKKYKYVKPYQLVINPYNKEAGIVPYNLDNTIVPYNYKVYEINQVEVIPEYLVTLLNTKSFKASLNKYNSFFNTLIPLPSYKKQRELLNKQFENIVYPFV